MRPRQNGGKGAPRPRPHTRTGTAVGSLAHPGVAVGTTVEVADREPGTAAGQVRVKL